MNSAIVRFLIAAFVLATASLGGANTTFADEKATPSVMVDANVVADIVDSCENGSLLFSQGDCLAVRCYTNSPYTHVGIVIEEGDQKIAYDSMNGVGVRKMSLEDYLTTQAPDTVHVFHPIRKLTASEAAELKGHLESQLGRPYSVKHHITGKRNAGLHCSEYVTDALVSIDWLKVSNPPRVSPASLAEGIELNAIYLVGPVYEVPGEIEPIPEPDGVCERIWVDVKLCTLQCCSKLSGWILCR
ncbi:YiiX/YebB-like N1pC/P60 family cysteine hydrolase [Thalassoglobus sp. JC818]|uniref:YiiX/YebB-like N1pC/P60 family cysteine hydrolase n=1 Tax=Thalassoglobus sp. JC818 TaxID=3232136 RepID=UPI003459EA94